jgi:septin family protein
VLRPSARVGFDTLPDQVVNRQALAGFRFNVLVVGETACGKSTLLDTLFNHAFPDSREGEGRTTAFCSHGLSFGHHWLKR